MNVHGNAIKREYSTGKEEMKIKKKKKKGKREYDLKEEIKVFMTRSKKTGRRSFSTEKGRSVSGS